MSEAVILQIAAGQTRIQIYTGDVAAGRPQCAVGLIATPTDIAFQNPVVVAVLIYEIGITFGFRSESPAFGII